MEAGACPVAADLLEAEGQGVGVGQAGLREVDAETPSEALQAGAGGDVDAAFARRPVAIGPSGVEETGAGSEVEVGAADGGERARRSVCGPGIARAPEQGVDLREGIVDGGAQNFEARSSGAVAPGFGRPHLLEIEGHISSEA